MENYYSLKQQYPDYISLEQFYKICRIAKRSAKYLVDNGIVPAIDSGKKTRRYKIAIDDVISYLRRRDREGSMIPTGMVTSRCRKASTRLSFSQIVPLEQGHEVAAFFHYFCAGYPDVLTTADVAELTGLTKSTIIKMMGGGHLQSISCNPKRLIPKKYLFEFVVTRRFLALSSGSEAYRKLLEKFEAWKSQQ